MFFNFRPGSKSTPLPLPLWLFLPNQHFTIIRTRRKDMSIFRVRPCYLPHRAIVSSCRHSDKEKNICAESENIPPQNLPLLFLHLAIHNLENSNSSIRGACCKSFTIIVQLSIVLIHAGQHKYEQQKIIQTYNHIIVRRLHRNRF